jgi:lipoprotein-anchoring transpeptidase ErfK/SrfK
MKQRMLALLVASAVLTSSVAYAVPQLVAVGEGFTAGTVLIRKQESALYFLAGSGQALRYQVRFGRGTKRWAGAAVITAMYTNPSWIPSSNARRENPRLPPFIPGGAPENPLGVAAMTLSGGEYSIHGTSGPSSIGRFGPYGCIRMFNEDAADLYRRVGVGTQVVVE